MKKFLYYFPRALSIILVGFFALFIAEGFDPEFGWQSGAAHAVLALVVGLLVVFTWRHPKVGGWVFVAMGVWHWWSVVRAGWYSGLFLGSVPILIGVLFLVEGFRKK
ncbi:MAG: hypothetical protein WCX97_03615 [Candidatus Magasanikbacteria bacterium]